MRAQWFVAEVIATDSSGRVLFLQALPSRPESDAFRTADQAGAFAKGLVNVTAVKGGKLTTCEGERAVRVEAARAVIEVSVPKAGRYPLRLAVNASQDATVAIHVSQRTPSRG